MNNAGGMHGICPLLAGETGSLGQRRNGFQTICAEVIFVNKTVF